MNIAIYDMLSYNLDYYILSQFLIQKRYKVILYLESFVGAGYIHFLSAWDILRLRPLKCEKKKIVCL